MDIWPILEEELVRYRDVSSSIRKLLMGYERECLGLISQVRNNSFESSQIFFDQLYDIQRKLSTVSYKYEFVLNDKLQDFVYHFDRDDIYSRKFWYQKFCDGMAWPQED